MGISYKILFGKSEGKRLIVTLRHRSKDNIKMCVRQIGYGLNSCGPGYGLVAGSRVHSNKPSDSMKGGEFLD